jgi:pimeloyl-ACP methyl ester carboxylesterase
MKAIGTTDTGPSRDGTRIASLSVGGGPSVLVVPGVLSMASDYAAFARALSQNFTVHTIERRGRGQSGPQGEDYSIVKECEDVLALQAHTGTALLVATATADWLPWKWLVTARRNGTSMPSGGLTDRYLSNGGRSRQHAANPFGSLSAS